MTISTLAKIIVGVNRMVVENVEIEYPEINPTLSPDFSKNAGTCQLCRKQHVFQESLQHYGAAWDHRQKQA